MQNLAGHASCEQNSSPEASTRQRITNLQLLNPALADFRVRGFAGTAPHRQAVLEEVGRTFIAGFNARMARNDERFGAELYGIDGTVRGFFAEGGAMAAAIISCLPGRTGVLRRHLACFGDDYTYLIHVGAGWAMARLPWRKNAILQSLDPVHFWLAYDGMGFHDTYFDHRRVLGGWQRIRAGYEARAYDQGIGRAVWFVAGANIDQVAAHLARFSHDRLSDLWAGVGLAMSYAGPADEADFEKALMLSGGHHSSFAQGVAFACAARTRAKFLPDSTALAVRAVWNVEPRSVSVLVERERDSSGVSADRNRLSYEKWRDAIATKFLALQSKRQ